MVKNCIVKTDNIYKETKEDVETKFVHQVMN